MSKNVCFRFHTFFVKVTLHDNHDLDVDSFQSALDIDGTMKLRKHMKDMSPVVQET